MKRPRNFDQKYMASIKAAEQLRHLADHLEKTSDYAYWNCSISVWNSSWDDPKFKGGCLTQATFCSKK